MSDALSTFSESWHRVAGQRISLRPSVRARRQTFRGEPWVVLDDPFNNQFYRLRPEAYEFVARLGPGRTVEEAWRECIERFPGHAPGQEAVLQLLSQLYHANLLHYPTATDASALFERQRKQARRETRSRLLNIMFARFPLLDPDRFLVRTLPVVGKLISPAGAVAWLATVAWALKVLADHFDLARDEAQGAIAPGNLFLLYTGMVLVKVLHEFGHAYFCRKFGGEVHAMGVLLMIFTPVPYVDATSAWGLRERWKRVLVGAAGMIVEVWVAALATFVWAATAPGTLHGLAYNIMLVASVSTLVFNINPLLRFDGYFMLSDLVGIPNLSQRATAQLRAWAERWLFGLRRERGPATSRREATWLGVYGATSGVYRVFVFAGILLVIADRFLLVGLLMAAVCAVAWVVVPAWKFAGYLAASPKLERHRLRASLVSTLGIGGLVAALVLVPVPHHFRAPGIVRSRQWTEIYNAASGEVARVLVSPGGSVVEGQPLMELRNHELTQQQAAAEAALAEADARLRHALQDAVPNVMPLQSLRESILKNIERTRRDQAALVVRAPHAGTWVLPESEGWVGRWLPQGTSLGLLVDPSSHVFEATVQQEDGDRLFASPILGSEARLHGQAGEALVLADLRRIPAEQRQLPSAALGWQARGPIATTGRDPEGRQAAEAFFEVHGTLGARPGVALLHGRSGEARFKLPPEPLLPRWIRALRQLLQKRYHV